MACKNLYIVETVAVGTSNIIMSFNTTPTFSNTQKVCFKLKYNPSSGDNLPVYISANGTNIPVWNKYGNPISGADLRKNRLYKAYYGTTSPHIIISNYPCNVE